jgi:hypothetical protein
VLNARHRCPKGQAVEAVAKACFARVYRAGPRDLINERGTQLKLAAYRAARGEDLLTPSSSPYYTHVLVDWVAPHGLRELADEWREAARRLHAGAHLEVPGQSCSGEPDDLAESSDRVWLQEMLQRMDPSSTRKDR